MLPIIEHGRGLVKGDSGGCRKKVRQLAAFFRGVEVALRELPRPEGIDALGGNLLHQIGR